MALTMALNFRSIRFLFEMSVWKSCMKVRDHDLRLPAFNEEKAFVRWGNFILLKTKSDFGQMMVLQQDIALRSPLLHHLKNVLEDTEILVDDAKEGKAINDPGRESFSLLELASELEGKGERRQGLASARWHIDGVDSVLKIDAASSAGHFIVDKVAQGVDLIHMPVGLEFSQTITVNQIVGKEWPLIAFTADRSYPSCISLIRTQQG